MADEAIDKLVERLSSAKDIDVIRVAIYRPETATRLVESLLESEEFLAPALCESLRIFYIDSLESVSLRLCRTLHECPAKDVERQWHLSNLIKTVQSYLIEVREADRDSFNVLTRDKEVDSDGYPIVSMWFNDVITNEKPLTEVYLKTIFKELDAVLEWQSSKGGRPGLYDGFFEFVENLKASGKFEEGDPWEKAANRWNQTHGRAIHAKKKGKLDAEIARKQYSKQKLRREKLVE